MNHDSSEEELTLAIDKPLNLSRSRAQAPSYVNQSTQDYSDSFDVSISTTDQSLILEYSDALNQASKKTSKNKRVNTLEDPTSTLIDRVDAEKSKSEIKSKSILLNKTYYDSESFDIDSIDTIKKEKIITLALPDEPDESLSKPLVNESLSKPLVSEGSSKPLVNESLSKPLVNERSSKSILKKESVKDAIGPSTSKTTPKVSLILLPKPKDKKQEGFKLSRKEMEMDEGKQMMDKKKSTENIIHISKLPTIKSEISDKKAVLVETHKTIKSVVEERIQGISPKQERKPEDYRERRASLYTPAYEENKDRRRSSVYKPPDFSGKERRYSALGALMGQQNKGESAKTEAESRPPLLDSLIKNENGRTEPSESEEEVRSRPQKPAQNVRMEVVENEQNSSELLEVAAGISSMVPKDEENKSKKKGKFKQSKEEAEDRQKKFKRSSFKKIGK